MRIAFALLLVAGTAHAGEHDATFAKHLGVAATAVHDVAGFELPAGHDFTHVLTGRFDQGTSVFAGAVLLSCTATACTGRRTEYGVVDAIELLGAVDLHGTTPAPLPTRAIKATSGYAKLPGARAMKFPALLVRTREKSRRVKLYVISLLEADRASTVLQDVVEEPGPGGRLNTRTYRFDKGDTKDVLDLFATESRCSEPAKQQFTLEEHHYRTKSYTPAKGC